MRLAESERLVIIQAIHQIDPQAEIWLIGSRADDRLSGGDIDLLIISGRIEFKEKINILVDIKLALGEQKIDVTVIRSSAQASDPFARQALQTAVRLA